MKSLVLDTSALLTLIEDEAGVEEVEALVKEALTEQVHLYLSVIAKIELFYISVQEQGGSHCQRTHGTPGRPAGGSR